MFLTRIVDERGKALVLTYDSSFRIVSVTDATGQETTVAYEHPTDPLKITKITDPAGRMARFDYNSIGQLTRITDTIGIQSSFTYGLGDLMSSLTTPYGTTRFRLGVEGQRSIEATDPMGGTERLEYNVYVASLPATEPASVTPAGMTVNNTSLNWRNTYYWSKQAMALHPGDYTKARITKWMLERDTPFVSTTPEGEKAPLENRVWYTCPPSWGMSGTPRDPIAVGRVLDDGTSQVSRLEYNVRGLKTKEIDPVGRETRYVYGTGSTPDPDPATGTGIDLIQTEQKEGASYVTTLTTTYDANHRPLTVTDAAGQTTTTTYLVGGRVESIVSPPRNGPRAARCRPLSARPRTATILTTPRWGRGAST